MVIETYFYYIGIVIKSAKKRYHNQLLKSTVRIK